MECIAIWIQPFLHRIGNICCLLSVDSHTHDILFVIPKVFILQSFLLGLYGNGFGSLLIFPYRNVKLGIHNISCRIADRYLGNIIDIQTFLQRIGKGKRLHICTVIFYRHANKIIKRIVFLNLIGCFFIFAGFRQFPAHTFCANTLFNLRLLWMLRRPFKPSPYFFC